MQPYRVVIVEDDIDLAHAVEAVLEKRLGCSVVIVGEPGRVIEAVARHRPDVVITDIEIPGASGLDLVAGIRRQQPGTPVIVMTAYASLDYAVQALRTGVDEFLTKPLNSADLVGQVTRLAEEFRAARAAQPGGPHRVLAIGAHPDDVEVGMGGVLAAHRVADDEVTILTLLRGDRPGGAETAWREASASAAIIGARPVFEDLGATDPAGEQGMPRIGTDHAALARVIRRVVEEVDPTIVYVHSAKDLREGHRVTHAATMTATEDVDTVACYQGTSASVAFTPTRFVSVERVVDQKLAMLECFARDDEHRPRYLDAEVAVATAVYWSRFGQGRMSEPFEIVRETALSPVAWAEQAAHRSRRRA
jgi:DNA-binding response OmpR family regulator